MKRLRNERVGRDDARQTLVKLLYGLCVLDGIEGSLIGHRLLQAVVGIIQGKGSNSCHCRFLFLLFRSSYRLS